jgi:dienelactone hydrolase
MLRSKRRRVARWLGACGLAMLLGAATARAQGGLCPGDCDGNGTVTIDELVAGVDLSLGLSPAGGAAAPPACMAFDRNGDSKVTIDELVRAVKAALNGCPFDTVDFVASLADEGRALAITPTRALLGSRTYALVLTGRVRDPAGRSLQADADFRALAGIDPPDTGGPAAGYDADPEAPANPYPEARLVRADGTVHVPDRFALRGMADTPDLATAREVLRRTADDLETVHGFSTTAPVRIALSAPVDPATVTPESVLFFERADGGLDLEGALAEAQRRGVARSEVALALSFPTQPIEDDLLAIRDLLRTRAASHPFTVTFEDPDPDDDLPIGVFGPDDPPFAEFLAEHPEVRLVAHGLFSSPNFRGPDGLFDPAKVSGAEPAQDVQLDFLLTIPQGDPPYPVVVLQHGFGGDNEFALSLGPDVAREGMAGIAISAVSHGRRGSPLALLMASPLQTRDIFRQTHTDQMALVRAIEAGIDIDGDEVPDVDSEEVLYLGQSLGGILGAAFVALEEAVQVAVLNVAGGRVAFLGDNPGTRPIFTSLLAMQAGLDVDSPEFEVFLQRMLELGQQGLDPADGLNYARRWRLDPLPDYAPRRVLIQEGIGDLLVNNQSTEDLAAAGGLQAQTPMSDPRGVSGLWRFDPPGGHGILSRPDVRLQAVSFLASDGTEIIDPAAP